MWPSAFVLRECGRVITRGCCEEGTSWLGPQGRTRATEVKEGAGQPLCESESPGRKEHIPGPDKIKQNKTNKTLARPGGLIL